MSDIKLFRIEKKCVTEMEGGAVDLERSLQTLIEKNLQELLGVSFLASEYNASGDRIDTLGLDENKCPVIIEYKRNSSQNVINQGLYYLNWLLDHKHAFELLVRDTMSKDIADDIDWSAPRLLCIAANFTKFDVDAIKEINHNIELIRYRRFGDDLLMFELLGVATGKTASVSTTEVKSKNQRKQGQPRKHYEVMAAEVSGEQKQRYDALVDFMLSLSDEVQHVKLKYYGAFKEIRNFACIELHNVANKITVYANLNPDEVDMIPGFTRDVRNVGHLGTGDVEITISSNEDLDKAEPLIRKAYDLS